MFWKIIKWVAVVVAALFGLNWYFNRVNRKRLDAANVYGKWVADDMSYLKLTKDPLWGRFLDDKVILESYPLLPRPDTLMIAGRKFYIRPDGDMMTIDGKPYYRNASVADEKVTPAVITDADRLAAPRNGRLVRGDGRTTGRTYSV
jgi:hypothetical protein